MESPVNDADVEGKQASTVDYTGFQGILPYVASKHGYDCGWSGATFTVSAFLGERTLRMT